tara:strand:- start:10821 stop:13499 length:2679 start_codon:yes stop_codon:yes gene_type:complete
MNNYTRYLIILLFFVEFTYSQTPEFSVANDLEEFVDKGDLTASDTDYLITSQHISSTSKVHHVYYSQMLEGIVIYGTESSIHLLPNGEKISANNRFIHNAKAKRYGSGAPQITSEAAIQIAATRLGYNITKPLVVLQNKNNSRGKTLFSDGGISINPIPVKQIYTLNDSNHLVLAWDLMIQELANEHWYTVHIDAISGEILSTRSNAYECFNFPSERHSVIENNKREGSLLTNSVNDQDNNSGCSECYEVFAHPNPDPYNVERTIEVQPAHNIASPFGWHYIDGSPNPVNTKTTGNNIRAYEAGDNNGYQPEGFTNLDFTGFPFDLNYSVGTQYEDAAITNMFYWGNIVHDVMYMYGFDEYAGNFQEVNYFTNDQGDNDPVLLEVQSATRPCNASFLIPYSGTPPVLKIGTCDTKDGAYDNTVLIHEYSHGTSLRLIGGVENDNCLLNGEQMGEGWSDWYALMMTMRPGDSSTDLRGIANFYRDTGPYNGGIREFPYTTDMSVNPLTYDSIKGTQSVHVVGTVWASMLWEVTWNLIDVFGYDPNIYNFTGNINQDAGNVMAMAIVTEALKFTPCYPGFIQARNAVIYAYKAIYGTTYECLLWNGFAKRGLGVNSNQADPDNVNDGSEGFNSIIQTATFEIADPEICLEEGDVTGLGGGSPFGGVYSGVGVTDDGNGLTYTFTPSIAGLGSHEITYTVEDGICTIASQDIANLSVYDDQSPPIINCYQSFLVQADTTTGFYTMEDFSSDLNVRDNCFQPPVITQVPPVGAQVPIGETTVTLTVTDLSGNTVVCNFELLVNGFDFGSIGSIPRIIYEVHIVPNPAEDLISITSNLDLGQIRLQIMDVNSRLVKDIDLPANTTEHIVNLDDLTRGIYFIKINSDRYTEVFQISKK